MWINIAVIFAVIDLWQNIRIATGASLSATGGAALDSGNQVDAVYVRTYAYCAHIVLQFACPQ